MNKIELREIDDKDFSNIVKYANNWAVAKNMADRFPHPYTEEDAEKFIALCRTDKLAFRRVISLNGNFAGMIGLHFMDDIFKRNAEIGYWIGEKH